MERQDMRPEQPVEATTGAGADGFSRDMVDSWCTFEVAATLLTSLLPVLVGAAAAAGGVVEPLGLVAGCDS